MSDDDATTCDDVTVVAEPTTPRELKEAGRDLLASLPPTGLARNDVRIQIAIRYIDFSLTPVLWTSETTLDPVIGWLAFRFERTTVILLQRVAREWGPPGVHDVIDAIVRADEGLARAAIDAALAAGGDPRLIARAEGEYLTGVGDVARGRPDTAVRHFEWAWRYAQDAMP